MSVHCLTCNIELQDALGMWTIEDPKKQQQRQLYRYCSKSCFELSLYDDTSEIKQKLEICVGSNY